MRILKFIGVFVGTLVVVFLLVFGFNLDALKTLYNNSGDLQEGQEWVSKATSLKGLTQYIGSNPQHTAVSSRSAINPDTTLAYGANQPHTMGTLSNFFLLVTYAQQVEDGKLDSLEMVSWDSIDRYQLPYIDASHHDDAKTALQPVTKKGKVPLNKLIEAAIIYNDLAISDYLYFRLGQDTIQKTIRRLELSHTDLPLPFSGLYITLHPVLHDTSFDIHFKNLQQQSKSDFRTQVLNTARRYVNNNTFHQKVRKQFEEDNGLGIGFTERRNLLSLFPKSTAGELSGLMLQLQQDKLISKNVSSMVKELMDWPYAEQGLNNDFMYYGAIYDNRLGLLNGMDYGASVYSEEPFGQAVFFDSLQVAFWFHMSSNLMHQDYQQRLMWDPALREATLQEISN